MNPQERLLHYLVNKYQSEWSHGHPGVSSPAGTPEHELEYAMLQLQGKIRNGLGYSVYGKTVVEIGFGHGGICIYAALCGAKDVWGLDVSCEAIATARDFQRTVEATIKRELPVRFELGSAERLRFKDGEVDVVIADNVLEHVADIGAVLRECRRILSASGRIVIPNFPSIYSKFGPHVKYGIKLPWVNAFFSERTIVRVMHELAKADPQMFAYYPGLKNGAETFRDVRAYRDFSYITNKRFLDEVATAELQVESYYVTRPLLGLALFKMMPILKRTRLDDILSVGTRAILKR
jgi:ubiquinone/menaquinone biosynthesis C-methylase UbiE